MKDSILDAIRISLFLAIFFGIPEALVNMIL